MLTSKAAVKVVSCVLVGMDACLDVMAIVRQSLHDRSMDGTPYAQSTTTRRGFHCNNRHKQTSVSTDNSQANKANAKLTQSTNIG